MESKWKYFHPNLKEYYLLLLNVKGVLKSEDMKSLMWPWPLTLNVSKTCQQPNVQVDLNIDNGAKAWGTVINQDFISDSELKSVWNYG